ncbi:adrenocorticotropic hormone receptor [Danio rerio]|uniref:Melanocyte-stimulating hormone receptor n=1 Tax=Danio rerio TaxID=7955 RepID=Q7ZTA2_DANRE|nr:adrenocorticotropic hormone receptor [Danio rerio]AAO24743.1 melanocortin 2 receptor [Danio rerio]|eukprot:NP_851302.1 adrenocorticotropic hormone receptor [Danio rerio]
MNPSAESPSSIHTDCAEVQVPGQVFLVIAVASLSENLLVIVAVIKNKNLHSPMYCFICNLAVFNTISSFSKALENILLLFKDAGRLNLRGPFELKIDDIMDSLLCMCFLSSIFSILAIAVDRYISIFHALRYHMLMTMRRVLIILFTIWVLCGTSGALMVGFFEAATVTIFFIVLFFTALLLILLLYVHMFLLARHHANRIASMPGAQAQHRKSGLRGALTLTIKKGVFVACWAPFSLHLLIMMICPENQYCECYRSLFQLHVVLLVSHAVIDPAINAFRSVELRNTYKKQLLSSASRICKRCA